MLRLQALKLRFADPVRETSFREDYFHRSVWLARGAVLLGCVQFALFGLLDEAMVPQVAGLAHIIRAVVCAYILGFLGFTFTRGFNVRTFQPAIATVPLAGTFGLAALVAFGQDLSGYYDYYAGQMLILFYIHALLRLRFGWAVGVSVVAIGVYLFVSGVFADTPPILQINNAFFLASANLSGMAASYGLEFYARRVFAQTEELREQQRALELEDARKSRELAAARQLQLASLPAVLPDHPAAEWAASMHSATEVGGDYYDWSVDEDGTLTLAIGDATGHGVQAGALVTATQAVFAYLSKEETLAEFLNCANAPIRRVGAGRLFMALAVARLRGHTLEVAGAGMPPALLFRAATGTVEPLSLKGLPLGTGSPFPYHCTSIELEPGDTVVFMTDGFPELFDENRTMYGYERAAAFAGDVVGVDAATVLRRLTDAALSWRGPAPPNDDVTFLVLRLKPQPVPVPQPKADSGLEMAVA